MRKKTIEEELKEIQEEKEEHIEKLEQSAGHSDDHRYDFTPEESPENSDIEKKIEAIEKKYNLNEEEKQAIREKAKKTFFASRRSYVGSMIVAIIFIAMGLGLAFGLGISPLIKASNYTPTLATVIHVDKYYDSDDDLMARITYQYYFDNVRYEKQASYSESANFSPKVGDTITVYVNPNNPNDVLDDKNAPIFMIVFGAIFAFVGIFIFLLCLKQKHKRRK